MQPKFLRLSHGPFSGHAQVIFCHSVVFFLYYVPTSAFARQLDEILNSSPPRIAFPRQADSFLQSKPHENYLASELMTGIGTWRPFQVRGADILPGNGFNVFCMVFRAAGAHYLAVKQSQGRDQFQGVSRSTQKDFPQRRETVKCVQSAKNLKHVEIEGGKPKRRCFRMSIQQRKAEKKRKVKHSFVFANRFQQIFVFYSAISPSKREIWVSPTFVRQVLRSTAVSSTFRGKFGIH